MEIKNNAPKLIHVATRGLAVVGLIAVIIAGLWGSILLARAVPGAFSSLTATVVSMTSIFVSAGENISLSPSSETTSSGESFILSWEHAKKSGAGSYAFRFACTPGVSFTSPAKNGAVETVPCDTPFAFLNANNAMVLTAYAKESKPVESSVAIEFTPDGASAPSVSGSFVLTIENGAGSEEKKAVAPAETITDRRIAGTETTVVEISSTAQSPKSDPNGAADLVIRMIEVGETDTATGVFTANPAPSRSTANRRIAVRFSVENTGTKTSDEWAFIANLPTTPPRTYTSPIQQTLGPGDYIKFTLSFDSFVDGTEGVFMVIVDPESHAEDANRDNNRLEETITVTK